MGQWLKHLRPVRDAQATPKATYATPDQALDVLAKLADRLATAEYEVS